jgi:Zn-dependent M28 family amino/carboxypeptidase
MPLRPRRAVAPAAALALCLACARDPSLGRHVDHPDFPADVAWSFLTDQVAFGPRYAGTKPHDREIAWLRDQLGFRADTLVVQPFTFQVPGGKPISMTNVLARWNPAAKERILLATHWDTHPKADQSGEAYERRYPVPGANGGASGTALLVGLAQVMHEQRPSVGVDLLFTDGDDFIDGAYLGTQAFLSAMPGYRPSFALVLGIVADPDAWLPQDAGSRRHAPAVVRRVWGVARQMGRDSVFAPQPFADSAGPHLALARAGIPAALVSDPELGPGNSYWHTGRDLPTHASAETLALVGEVVAEVIYRGVPEERR